MSTGPRSPSNMSIESNDNMKDVDSKLIGDAYRVASSNDAMAIKTASKDDISAPKAYYLVPFSWMNNFQIYIASKNESRRPQKIKNALLLNVVAQSPSTELEGVDMDTRDDYQSNHEKNIELRQVRCQKWAEIETQSQKRLANSTLKQGLSHGLDYAIVGEETWGLISRKFGYDVPLKVSIRFLTDDEKLSLEQSCSGIVIAIYPDSKECPGSERFIPIPENFKFEYGVDNTDNAGLLYEHGTDGTSMNALFNDSNLNNETTNENINESTPPLLLLPPSSSTTSTSQNFSQFSLEENRKDNIQVSDDDDSDSLTENITRKRKRFGAGLGNLGNTCFMNSTLQCLAHTPPLRYYFLSGEYLNDLNKDNPLGTGGELAIEFSKLLAQMWGTDTSSTSNQSLYSSSRNVYGSYTTPSYDSLTSSVVYPRNFKDALGKHAEQFIGYDQHDSQELATYLLDALHEDTNRISKKPYIEKPEQGEDESDEEAATKAWNLHLKRENSRVLQNFMGQIKSRVQCPVEGCGRVSTTFDPFMYLSVPIPGISDRSIAISFVSMNPSDRVKKLQITLKKTSTVLILKEKIVNALSAHVRVDENLDSNNMSIVDIWNGEVYTFYCDEDLIEKIRESDTIYAYEIASTRSIEKNLSKNFSLERTNSMKELKLLLDSETRVKLNFSDQWEEMLQNYLIQPLSYTKIISRTTSREDKVNFYNKIILFLEKCYSCLEHSSFLNREEMSINSIGSKVNEVTYSEFELELDDSEYDSDKAPIEESFSTMKKSQDKCLTLKELCAQSESFTELITQNDVAILEFCAQKFYKKFLNEHNEAKVIYPQGTEVQVIFSKPQKSTHATSIGNNNSGLSLPLVMRISPELSVYNFRKLLATRLSRVLTNMYGSKYDPPSFEGTVSDEEEKIENYADHDDNSMDVHRRIEEEVVISKTPHYHVIMDEKKRIDILRQVPLTYERGNTSYSYKASSSYRKLGSINKVDDVKIGCVDALMAAPEDNGEKDLVLDIIGKHGKIYVHWPFSLFEQFFDEEEFTKTEDLKLIIKEDANPEEEKNHNTLLSCIKKYCQKEQLEETEMWYCNRCKEHVCAWKQFHLYRTPPILIVHLKRFHFSSLSHRRDKIDLFIDFPLKGLDLSDEVMHWKDDETPIYDCYAVSNHYGGLGGGHYTAYARNDSEEWSYFDDSRVTPNVEQNKVKSSAAYVLYYKRRDVKLEDDTKFSSNCSISTSSSPSESLEGEMALL
mmetsp:Transcript_19097/g.26884  ORF Transcript_19097/g.26884 Transcript_19097/m.26884 type:complete len:1237 (-) Transcript_19097:844-4554(-)